MLAERIYKTTKYIIENIELKKINPVHVSIDIYFLKRNPITNIIAIDGQNFPISLKKETILNFNLKQYKRLDISKLDVTILITVPIAQPNIPIFYDKK